MQWVMEGACTASMGISFGASLQVQSPGGICRAFNMTKLTPVDRQTLVYRAEKSRDGNL